MIMITSTEYELHVDDDIKAVAQFMQTHVAADRLTFVAAGVAAMAPLLWGRYKNAETIQVLRLEAPPLESR